MSYELRLILAIKRAEEDGFHILAEAWREMLRKHSSEKYGQLASVKHEETTETRIYPQRPNRHCD